MKMCKYGKGMHYYWNIQDFPQKKRRARMLFVIFARRHSAVGVCAAVRVVAGYCWSATSVMGLPMQEFGIWMRSMAQTVGATSTM